MPIHSIFKLSLNARTVPTPIRIPVKEPGPLSQTIKSISDKDKLVSLKTFSIAGIIFSE